MPVLDGFRSVQPILGRVVKAGIPMPRARSKCWALWQDTGENLLASTRRAHEV